MPNFPSNVLFNVGNAKPPQTQVSDPEGLRKELYRVVLTSKDIGGSGEGQTFETWLGESFQIAVQSTWDSPFNVSLSELLLGQGKAGQIAKAAETTMGVSSKLKVATGSVWQDTSPINITLPFHFKAKNDPKTEVVEQAMKLMLLAVPGESGPVLVPPGPKLGNAAGLIAAVNQVAAAGANAANLNVGQNFFDSGDQITVKIGKFLVFENVVIESVTLEIGSQFDKDGNPLSATVEVGCKTFFVSTKTDVRKMFSAFNRVKGGN